VPALKGFGLMQRDRAFRSYEDTEARYELRPSVWVEPLGQWGPGRITLLQLPAADETVDNITAFWTFSRTPLAPGQSLDVAYRLHWQGALDQKPPQGWVTQSRLGHGWQILPPDQVQYVVDFAGPALAHLAPDAPVQAVVSAGASGDVLHSNAFWNEATSTWRMTVNVRWKDPSTPLELRGFLKLAHQTLTETWNPILPARRP
jgi:glucans biosynthesis protein